MHEIKVVESLEKYNTELNKKIDTLDKAETGIVMTPETFHKVFSPERIKLLQRIYRNNVKSIYGLAKELDKPYEVVFRNLKYLEGIGLIRIHKKDNRSIPSAYDFSVDMFART